MHEFTAKARLVKDIQDSHNQAQKLLGELERNSTRTQVDSGSHFHSLIATTKERFSRLLKEIEKKEWQFQHISFTIVEALRKEADRIKKQEGDGAYMDADRRRYRFQVDTNDEMATIRKIKRELQEKFEYLT